MKLVENRGTKKTKILANRVRKIPRNIIILTVLIIIAIPLYYRMMTAPELTFEDQMKEYSKYVQAPVMKIDINYKNYQKILYERDKALNEKDPHFTKYTEFSYVPATIEYKSKKYKCKLRLKGLRKQHLRNIKRLSFRVKLKGDETIDGMKVFSLHDPIQRNYIYEWMFHDLLKKEDFIALKYDFINVKINGTDNGIYAIEEHFSKALLERYGYKDGPIFKLRDDKDSNYVYSTIPFDEDKYFSKPFDQITNKAKDLLTGLMNADFNVEEATNYKMLAKYYALCDFFNIYHGGLIKSIRMYYNPITSKFEPIGFDGHFDITASHSISGEKYEDTIASGLYIISLKFWHKKIFGNKNVTTERFWREYIKYLNKYSSIEFVNSYFANIADEFTEKLAITYKNSPLYQDMFNAQSNEEFRFSKQYIVDQAKYIRDLLYPRQETKKLFFDSYIYKNELREKIISVKFSNNHSLPVIIDNLAINDTIIVTPIQNYFILPSEEKFIRNYRNYYFNCNLSVNEINSAVLNFHIPETDSLISSLVNIKIRKNDNIKQDIFRKKAFPEKYKDILNVNKKNRIISFKNKKQNIFETIKIEEGWKVIINEGSEIVLKDSAFILSYSPVIINGTKRKPIKISSKDRLGGIVVINASETSVLENVEFVNLSYPRENEWKLTGAITFYDSDVILKNVKISNNLSEDALNIVKSDFKIENTKFINISNDAFDSDFSRGLIRSCDFVNCGNDGIDFSGSEIKCDSLIIKNAGDKAVSAGEGSVVEIDKIYIHDSEIGVASKDNSIISGKGADIFNTRLGCTAYQKKSEYGPGKIELTGSKMLQVEKEYLIELGSILIMNGNKVSGKEKKVAEKLYGNEYGIKSSK